jgi:hypothetical protein
MALRFIKRSSSVCLQQYPANYASAFISARPSNAEELTACSHQLSAHSFCGSCLTERHIELAKQKDILLHGTSICNRETPEPRKG